ncbi:MAG: leucine-rich repeat domain-containing protein [Chitinivibrionales bacterium]|nr:leucine-rich repeat domain-containing protein [Chitinivibrionales bacterium]
MNTLHVVTLMIIAAVMMGEWAVAFGAEDNRRNDSLALVAIKNANPQMQTAWNTAEALDRWEGVHLNNGRVDSLTLCDNHVATLPAQIGNLTNLVKLDMSRNLLTTIPAEMGKIAALRSLYCENNLVTSLPEEIGNCTNLIELYLGNNQLVMVPVEIRKLVKLSWLVLNNNQITMLPADIGDLVGLEILFLQGNKLTTLPPEIGKLSKLHWLYLYENEMTKLPAEIGNCTSLTELNLNNNQFASIPPQIGNLTKLYKLVLFNNRLTTLPEELGNLLNITQLEVSCNNLSEPNIPANLLPWLDKNDPDWRITQNPVGISSDQKPVSSVRPLTLLYTGTALTGSRPIAPNSSFILFSLSGRTITECTIEMESSIQSPPLPAGKFLWRITEGEVITNGIILIR